ncbi:MAG: hypothetical protein CMB56_003845 [Methanobacteriota archaeon]|nr:MAG: hypothetical protein CMB56_003845 [Euryarchaeota archaeon]|tara:strand:- start:2615 stop:3118 length:504 start_codon:yes stop_codon:yes gene_type:complete
MSYLLLEMSVAILDTAALLAWPIEKISNSVVAESQFKELENVSLERALLVESLDLKWISPDHQSIEKARIASAKSGDLAKLSEVDIDLIALCFQLDEILFTDDYRIQNTLNKAGMRWSPVIQRGITESWEWVQICTGCGKSFRLKSKNGREICNFCGSPMKLKRKKR